MLGPPTATFSLGLILYSGHAHYDVFLEQAVPFYREYIAAPSIAESIVDVPSSQLPLASLYGRTLFFGLPNASLQYAEIKL